MPGRGQNFALDSWTEMVLFPLEWIMALPFAIILIALQKVGTILQEYYYNITNFEGYLQNILDFFNLKNYYKKLGSG